MDFPRIVPKNSLQYSLTAIHGVNRLIIARPRLCAIVRPFSLELPHATRSTRSGDFFISLPALVPVLRP